MAVTIEQLREFRAAGVKTVQFVDGQVTFCEFFPDQPEAPPAAEGETATARAMLSDDEVPPVWAEAVATIQRRGVPPKKASST